MPAQLAIPLQAIVVAGAVTSLATVNEAGGELPNEFAALTWNEPLTFAPVPQP